MYVCMHVGLRRSPAKSMHTCMYVCMYVCMYACETSPQPCQKYACMHVCMRTCTIACALYKMISSYVITPAGTSRPGTSRLCIFRACMSRDMLPETSRACMSRAMLLLPELFWRGGSEAHISSLTNVAGDLTMRARVRVMSASIYVYVHVCACFKRQAAGELQNYDSLNNTSHHAGRSVHVLTLKASGAEFFWRPQSGGQVHALEGSRHGMCSRQMGSSFCRFGPCKYV